MLAVPMVEVAGAPLAGESLRSVEVIREANRIPAARLLLEAPAAGPAPPAMLEDAQLVPGAAVTLKVREGDRITPLFTGVVVRLALALEQGVARLAVECRDKAIGLTAPRRTLIHGDGTTADAVGAIVRRQGLALGAVDSPGPAQEALVQHDCSDWDFILTRAEAAGLVVVVTDGSLALRRPVLDGAEALSLKLGTDVIEAADFTLDGLLPPDAAATAWDLAEGATAEPSTAQNLTLRQGTLDPADLATAIGVEADRIAHLAPIPPDEVTALASGRLARARLAHLRGRLAIPGRADVAPLALVRLAGFSRLFDGVALVGAVRHLLEAGGWTTDLGLGLPADRLAERVPDVAAPAAAGLLPPARGLSVGIIASADPDPAGDARVQVRLPAVSDGPDLLWARLMTPEAGPSRGVLFRPRAGDEVVIGHLADDPRHPVVLGALFSARNPPPEDLADANNIGRGIATENGAGLLFRDQDSPVATLRTPAMALTLDEEAGELTLSDGNSSLTLSSEGMVLKTAGKLTIEASGQLVLKGATIDAN